MAKKESTFRNMFVTLLGVSLLAAGLLGSVYSLTKEPIRLAELRQKNEAIGTVVPGFDNEPSQEVRKLPVDGDTLYFYTCRQGEQRILVVTHSGLLQWIIKATLDNRGWFPILPMGNCSLYKLVVDNQIVPPSPHVEEETPFYTWRWELMDHRLAD